MDLSLHESKLHGTATFPYVVYRGIIPGFLKSYPLHWHDEMELIYVISGTGTVTAWSAAYQVSAGDMVFLPPQTVHSISQKDACEMEYFNILFRFSLLNEDSYMEEKYFRPFRQHTRSFPVHVPSGTELNRLLQPHLNDLIVSRKREDYALMIKSHLLAVLHQLYQHSAPANDRELTVNRAYDRLKNALTLVHEHYADPLSVSQAAKLCHFSESHFMKLFKEFAGVSFTRYLLRYRLEIAAELLAGKEVKIIDAAERVGFHNHSYFTRAFLQAYGVTPSAYRRRAQAEEKR